MMYLFPTHPHCTLIVQGRKDKSTTGTSTLWTTFVSFFFYNPFHYYVVLTFKSLECILPCLGRYSWVDHPSYLNRILMQAHFGQSNENNLPQQFCFSSATSIIFRVINAIACKMWFNLRLRITSMQYLKLAVNSSSKINRGFCVNINSSKLN